MRKLKRNSSKKDARASNSYELGLIRPFGKVVQRFARAEFGLEEDPARVHPVYAWQDAGEFLHLVCGTTAGPVLLSIWKSDMAALLKDQPFARYELTPDPSASIARVRGMLQKGMLPRSWENAIMNEPEDPDPASTSPDVSEEE